MFDFGFPMGDRFFDTARKFQNSLLNLIIFAKYSKFCLHFQNNSDIVETILREAEGFQFLCVLTLLFSHNKNPLTVQILRFPKAKNTPQGNTNGK